MPAVMYLPLLTGNQARQPRFYRLFAECTPRTMVRSQENRTIFFTPSVLRSAFAMDWLSLPQPLPEFLQRVHRGMPRTKSKDAENARDQEAGHHGGC